MIFRQNLQVRVNLNLAPLIDVVFQLVIFFMISSVFNTTVGIELDLPDSSRSKAVKVSPIVISVVNSQEIYLNHDLIPLASLGKVLQSWKNQGRLEQNKTIVVEGDRNVSYDTIIAILDEIKKGGVDSVNLITAPAAEKE